MTRDSKLNHVDQTPRVYPPMPSDEELFAKFGGMAQAMAENPELTEEQIRTVAALGLL